MKNEDANDLKEIQILDNDYDDELGDAITEWTSKLDKNSYLLFVTDDHYPSYLLFAFKDKHSLKSCLLNGFLALDHEARDEDYYEMVADLKKLLEATNDLEVIFDKLRNVIYGKRFEWAGHITELLEDESEFAEELRDGFVDELFELEAKKLSEQSGDKDYHQILDELEEDESPERPFNRLDKNPPDDDVMQALVNYLEEFLA